MTNEPPITKQALLAALRETETHALERLATVDASGWETGRYENGWNARQILAHVASIEWTYPRLLDIARTAGQAEAARADADVPTRPVRGGMDAYNQRQVEQRAAATPRDLIDEFRANRARTIAAVEEADEALLAVPIRSGGGITGSLGRVIYATAVEHVRTHIADIAGGAPAAS